MDCYLGSMVKKSEEKALVLYNSMSRAKEAFRPRAKGRVKIFTCGPSIYQRPHIGNYRTFLYEDLLARYLEHLGYRVERSIILTDIEDKAIDEALKKGAGLRKVTGAAAHHFLREAKALHIALPDPIPRATTTIDAAVDIIRRLLKKGIAYRHGGNIYFDPLKYPGFGRLYGLDMKKWPRKKTRFSRDTYNGRRWNRGDFILWHGYREGDIVSWNTPVGRGRPSWNIQDPAVVLKHLGGQVDINCGGIDNIVRHHDYNIAVMEAATGKEYARYYLHGEHLVVRGKTMSKSRGNILYPGDVIGGAIQPRHLRFFLIYRHYRKKLNYTEESFTAAAARLDDFRAMVKRLLAPVKGDAAKRTRVDPGRELLVLFETALNDDLGAGKAFDDISASVKRLLGEREKNGLSRADITSIGKALREIDEVLRVIF
ncbi:MAG: class I tRNA ligase family protein [Spirochaetes bacterium]|nr:class I tRNA ligase family protein [Spirochaetota bacterium]